MDGFTFVDFNEKCSGLMMTVDLFNPNIHSHYPGTYRPKYVSGSVNIVELTP